MFDTVHIAQSPVQVLPLPTTFDRRNGVSPLEQSSQTLENAVAYLVHLNRTKRENVQANRQAIALLCEAARAVAATERREEPRERTRGWLSLIFG